MKTTDADSFTFTDYYSALIVGPSGSGKTELARRLIERYQKLYQSDTIKFVLIDPRKKAFPVNDPLIKREYLFTDIITSPEKAIDTLERLSIMSIQRSFAESSKPFLFIYIDENDIAAYDQKRFDTAMMTLVKNAKKADMKVVYTTSNPTSDVVSPELRHNFDIILYGHLLHKNDISYLDLPKDHELVEHTFGMYEQHPARP